MKINTTLGLLAGKLSGSILEKMGRGSTLPGKVALKMCIRDSHSRLLLGPFRLLNTRGILAFCLTILDVYKRQGDTMSEIYDITIVGGGPVGLFAAFYGNMRQVKVKLIDSLPQLGGQPAILYPEKNILDVPGFTNLTGEELSNRLIEQVKRFDTCLLYTSKPTKGLSLWA